MVRLPRDVRPRQLIRVLRSYGFEETRQSGSHIVLKHPGPPEFSIVVPNHVTIKTGTLHSILSAASVHLGIEIAELASKL